MSDAFPVPPKVVTLCQEKKIEFDAAFSQVGFSLDPRLGRGKGIIYELSNGEINRETYVSRAIRMAFIPFDRPEFYR